jgi:hypothetical protein
MVAKKKATVPRLLGKHPKKAKLQKPKLLVFGAPGVGKTWAAIEWPGVYYIDCEGGATLPHYTDKLEASGGAYVGPEDNANDFDTVVGQVLALATHKHDYRTLVFDSFSKLFNTAVQVEYDRLQSGGRDMSKSFGAEKKPAIAKTRQIISWLNRLDMNVLFVCHERVLWKDGESIGETFDAWDKLAYELDLTMQVTKIGTKRKARICKCRLEQFREGELIDWGYKPFAERYGAEVVEAESQPVEPATEEQIRVMVELAEVAKLDTEQRLKWFEKAGVTSWGEMDGDTIQKCIEFLKKTLAPATA